ncbi:helix-turn-helix domain-containing protein [Pseudofrankia sp. BMG5.37]|uniref:helix-turn-helix transcriptional regulator n=1 Tax=Pseudofrankia sp. BMG5.37 TaxID=3050035 RepID=UPI0028955A13|nr:helix-turn-helix domain-containing protein [Pseudofrankia sp. BMG5.37]MDT3441312.1 helix-turn-helix domain-containing protein [Pseudofrankia sp. BMG5.37]
MGIPKLWTSKDIAARLDVSSERVRQLSHRDDFPPPVGEVGHIRVWSEEDVEQWISEKRPGQAGK